MSSVEHSIFINVPVDTVFEALLRVEDAPKWVVGLEEVHDVTGAQRWRHVCLDVQNGRNADLSRQNNLRCD
jgi:uncharacterized protein YndB with AHSA1/START domain